MLVTTNENSTPLTFVGDIVTVSDFGTHEKNAVWFLYEKILTMALKLGVDFSTLGWRVGDAIEGKYPNQHVKVMLPSKPKIQSLLNTSVKPFLRCVKTEPLVRHELIWKEPGVDFRLIHNPSQTQSDFGGPLVATAAYSLTENPLYERLHEKARALEETKYVGLRGIIAVDGDCYSIRSSPYGNGSSYDAKKIVAHFLANYPAIAFVTTTYCESRTGFAERGYRLRHYIHFQSDLVPSVRGRLDSLLRAAIGEMPQPVQSPANALRDIVERKEISRGWNFGAYEIVGARKLSIPVRVFLPLLTRTMSDRDFRLLFYETMPPDGGYLVHFFRTLAISHSPLKRVSVRLCPDQDDDWITFEVGSFESSVAAPVDPTRGTICELPVSLVVEYLGWLDYAMSSGRANHSFLPGIPEAKRSLMLKMLSKGRLLNSAQLIDGGNTIRLSFGSRDAAISPYS